MPGESDIAGLYRRMVDGNVIRKDLSFAEMARAARNYAADPATEANDLSGAVAALFQSAPYSKRSYIQSFAFLLGAIGDYLDYPAEIPRALGVTLARELKDRPEIVGLIKDALSNWDGRTIQDELSVLKRFAGDSEEMAVTAEAAQKSRGAGASRGPRTKTTFHTKELSWASEMHRLARQARDQI